MVGPIAKQAVVIGAGIGGLAAAKAVAPFFEGVVVLDRDSLPDGPESRAGTPQDRHTHVLLAGGSAALSRLFPGVERELVDEGAIKARLYRDLYVEFPGHDPLPRRDVGVDMFCQSRPLIEYLCRRSLLREPNVEVVSRARVTGIEPSADLGAAAGVRCEDEKGSRTLPADLVIDASGRGAPTLAFLEAAGRPNPPESEIGIDMAYATAIFEPPRDRPDWSLLTHIPARPKFRRSGALIPIEGGRWIVSLGGVHGDNPPNDLEGYLAFAATFRTPKFHDAIRSARLLGEITRFNLPRSVRRHFEQVERFPRGLIPIGDSICRFNPVYGQGMTVAAQEAIALARLLEARRASADPLSGLASEFFAEASATVDTPWAVALGDFAYPETRGERPPDFERTQLYQDGLVRLVVEDPEVQKLSSEVNHLLKPRNALREPALAQRVTALLKAG